MYTRYSLVRGATLAIIAAAAVAPVSAVAAPAWTRIDSANPPPARFDHTITFDPASQKLVLFGGRTGAKTLGDTWVYEFGSKSWHEVKTPSAPEARFGHAAAYDPVGRRVLLFAGQAGGFFNDVWSFDPIAETWRKLETRAAAPNKRYGTAAVVDTKRNQLIISHGFTDAGRFDDTQALDLTTNTWSKIQPVAARPLKRCLHDAVYDGTNDRVILFGGCSSGAGPCPQGDLWSLDIAGRDWREVKPAGSKPSARDNASLVSDGAGRVILFGGQDNSGASDEVWSLEVAAGQWTRLGAPSVAPAPRSNHDAVWNAGANQMILFGGIGDDGALNDLWVMAP